MVKTILITGASGQLGLPLVQHFSSKSYRVLGTWSGQKPGLVHPMVEWVQWTAGDLSGQQKLADRLYETGDLMAWFHLAGGFWGGSTLEMTPLQQVHHMMQMNFFSASDLVPLVIPSLKNSPHASVLFIGAEAGLSPSPGYGAYGASKASLHYLADTLAREAGGKGITVNTLVPAIIDTASNRTAMPDGGLDKWIKPAEIAALIEFLISPAGSAINGSTIRLNK